MKQMSNIVHACRHYFDMSPQIWSSKDVNTFRRRTDFRRFLRAEAVSCIIALGVFHTYRLLKGTSETNIESYEINFLQHDAILYCEVIMCARPHRRAIVYCVVIHQEDVVVSGVPRISFLGV